MVLADRVHIARRFQRSIKIDSDLNDPNALEGFICPQSSAEVLATMARHVGESGQGAFTWTGPYGSGKSSLVIALSALLSGGAKQRKHAAEIIGNETAEHVWSAMPPLENGWQIVPVVGRREDPKQVIGEALEAQGVLEGPNKGAWTEKDIVDGLRLAANEAALTAGGLVLFIDEMGKFLEAAAQEGADVYLFQQLAEAASRSGGRLIVVGILHQAFEEYAHRLSREMRDEWSKIQGRFVDLAVNTAGEEQIDLLSRAIQSDHPANKPGELAENVAAYIKKNRPSVGSGLAQTLEACWPLHPVVAALLGPISRRRFGQNQRSLFGFLNSAEPNGFQDFIRQHEDADLYEPHRLWDYLRINLEPAILASPDGHRWAMAAEAIERCEAVGGEELHLKLLKLIALVDLFRERSGLLPSEELFQTALPSATQREISSALKDLKSWSFIIYRKHLNAYSIYAGSDFDIDHAVSSALEEVQDVDFSQLRQLAGLQPILAKRHYHETGALRWFDADIAPLDQIEETAAAYQGQGGTIGQFLLAIPTSEESQKAAERWCRDAARQAKEWDVVVGLSKRAWGVTELARELIAIQKVSDERVELQGDAVARREVHARMAALQSQLESELRRAFDNAVWYRKHHSEKRLNHTELNILASELASKRYEEAPRIHNELLNRTKPSSSAVAGQNALLKRMVNNEGEERLGITGYPAEGGLFDAILWSTGLYRQTDNGYEFQRPEKGQDPCNLAPLWDRALEYLKENSDRSVSLSEIYDCWRARPLGVKDGLLPLLSVAFILSERESLAFYREGIFQAQFNDLDVDYLAKDPNTIQLRWMDLSAASRRLLSDMAEVVRELDENNRLKDLEPIDVARGLIGLYTKLPNWTKRTMQLSSKAVRIRNIFKHAHDPNKFLFDDLPAVLGENIDVDQEEGVQELVSDIRDGLKELIDAYPDMLRRLQHMMLSELQVPNMSPQALADLRERAENVKGLDGDLRLNAFIGRLASFDGSMGAMEGVAGVAAEKPARDWIDQDLDRAAIQITELSQRFNRNEAYARVKGRQDKRHSMAVVVGMGDRPTPLLEEFDITDSDRAEVDEIVSRVEDALADSDLNRKNVILAALAELSSRYMQPDQKSRETKSVNGKVAS